MDYAKVIPVLKTPRNVDYFDYSIPAGQEFSAGDLVVVPFRNHTAVGLIASVSDSSAVASKALPLIGSYAGLKFPTTFLAMLDWLGRRTFCSQPTVLKSFLRQLPKRLPLAMTTVPSTNKKIATALITHWQTGAREALVLRALQAQEHGQKTLIVTPWQARLEAFSRQLPGSAILSGDLSDGAAFKTWQAFISGDTRTLITTRLGAWLSVFSDLVLLDEPENDDHKQDELTPRYDARLMLAWCAYNANLSLETFGLTPPLHVDESPPEIAVQLDVHVRHPQGGSFLPLVQADTLQRIMDHEGPTVIVHPIRGNQSRFRCRDCGWEASCAACGFPLNGESEKAVCRTCGKKYPAPQSCAHCQGTDLGKSLPGIDKLKQVWDRQQNGRALEFRDLTPEVLDAPFAPRSLVVLTDVGMIGGVSEDIRRKERQAVAFRRLAERVAAVQGELIIQCAETSSSFWAPLLTTEGYRQFKQAENTERRVFGYPPAVRVVKAIITGDQQLTEAWERRARETLPREVEIRGPFMVQYRSQTRQTRQIYHLVFRTFHDEASLLAQLTSLAQDAIIDLDPVAFFR